jgi:hypothetical protein
VEPVESVEAQLSDERILEAGTRSLGGSTGARVTQSFTAGAAALAPEAARQGSPVGLTRGRRSGEPGASLPETVLKLVRSVPFLLPSL